MRGVLGIGILVCMVWVSACSSDNKDQSSQSGGTVADRPFSGYQDELLATVYDPIRPLADFTLEGTNGETFSLNDQRGKVSLIYFGFMNCPDICPTTLAQLREAYLELGEPADQLNVYFITIDPERDTLENMGPFMQLWHADFVGLHGQGETLDNVLDMFDVVAIRRELPDSAIGYLMDHSADVYIIDPDGNLVAEFAYGVTASTVVHDLSIILENEF